MKKSKTAKQESALNPSGAAPERTGAGGHTAGPQLDPRVAALLESPVFTDLDRQFAKFVARLAGTTSPEVVLAAAMLSRARADGHTCLDLRAVAGSIFPQQPVDNVEPIACPEFGAWTRELTATAVVGAPGEFKPLILDQAGRLYLHRYWEYEHALATEINRRGSASAGAPPQKAFQQILERFFPAAPGDAEPNWQRIAAQVAVQKQLCVISGGPGTGKTWTLVRILALLVELAGDKPIQIAVAAPTGKAAARVQEEIRKAKSQLQCSEAAKARLPERALTIHRLLGASRDATAFRFNRANPLPFDVVAVDEAGMVDLALMARLVDALAPHSKLILLGDKDQLASVEPGAVLGDICAGLEPQPVPGGKKDLYPGANLAAPARTAPTLAACIVQLQKNYRFSPQSQIYRLSRAVNAGDAAEAIRILRDAPPDAESAVRWVELQSYAELKTLLAQRLVTGFADYFAAQTPADALNALARFRVLCALREGPFGVMHINRLAEQIFEDAGLITVTGPFYPRRPVMITRNDYNLQLFNGDTGAILPHQPEADATPEAQTAKGEPAKIPLDTRAGASAARGANPIGTLPTGNEEFGRERAVRAFFAGPEGGLRAVLPARLPEHETAYAITVHKSQGSEFDHVLVILPDRDVPLLTRELIYTGITRARKTVEIWAPEPVLATAITRRTTRSSGLRDALWP
ncbi:MAG: exodeoxyribonuclease V subunit alpha, partial [Verrucomicrobiae bacterium]|nr:exodeoxyribonuclease V subunit alpha [Verrucomicrobiae bacterium]